MVRGEDALGTRSGPIIGHLPSARLGMWNEPEH